MAKKKIETNNMEEVDFTNNVKETEGTVDLTPIKEEYIERQKEVSNVDLLRLKKQEEEDNSEPINPLKNETVIVRYIPNGKFPNPKHVFHGGLAQNGVVSYCVPSLENGTLKNPLTNTEKVWFEQNLGLDKGALSVYKKGKDNFWSTANPNGIGSVELKKQDNYFDLSNPTDWLKMRILQMHPEEIAMSYKEIQDNPATNYKFVVVHDASEAELKKNKQYYTKESWKLLGKIEDNKWAMKFIVERLEGRPISSTTKKDVLSTRCGDLIESNATRFYAIITDEYFDTKVLMDRCVEGGYLNRRNGYYYTKEGEPLCGPNQNSTEDVAAKYLNLPKNQNFLFLLQEQVKQEN